ncbi:MAG: hypothetical protein AAGB04_00300 [Pseudomonadota bacterium]
MSPEQQVNRAIGILTTMGVDHEKIATVPLFKTILQEYVAGQMEDTLFRSLVRKICIFNPGIMKTKPPPRVIGSGKVLSAKIVSENKPTH